MKEEKQISKIIKELEDALNKQNKKEIEEKRKKLDELLKKYLENFK